MSWDVLHSIKTFYVYSASKNVGAFPILTLYLSKSELQSVRQVVWVFYTYKTHVFYRTLQYKTVGLLCVY